MRHSDVEKWTKKEVIHGEIGTRLDRVTVEEVGDIRTEVIVKLDDGAVEERQIYWGF